MKELALQEVDKDKQKKAAEAILVILEEKYAPRLWKRLEEGESLSDREMGFLMFTKFPTDSEKVDKFIEEFKKRDLALRSEALAFQYTEEEFGKLSSQTAQKMLNIPIYVVTIGWDAFLQALAKSQSNSFGKNVIASLIKAPVQYWTIAGGVTAVFVLWDTVKALYKFSKDEITKKEAIKRISESISTNVGGFGGAHLGIAIGGSIGALGGPIGAIIGSIIGCFAGALIGSLLGSLLNKELWRHFDKDPSEAKKELIKKAYETLDALKSTPPEDIKRRYRQKLLSFHPDKNPGATAEELEFLKSRLIGVRAAYALLISEGVIEGNYKKEDDELKIKVVRKAIDDDEF